MKSGRIMLAGLLAVISSVAWAELTGSKHDFSAVSWNSNDDGYGMCRPCHTPHNALPAVAPLWNHVLSTASYIPYQSDTMDQVSVGPNSSSKLCLSCHDGTTALDSFGGVIGSTYLTGTALLGTDLSNDHPIGIRWQHTDGASLDCMSCHDGDMSMPWTLVKRADMPLYPISDGAGGLDYTVECASCHEPHNKEDLGHLLKVTNVASALCKQCHVK